MGRKAFFCYEKTFAGKWSPVVHFDDRPGKSFWRHVERSPIQELSTDNLDCFDAAGEPMFGRLMVLYPPPQEAETA